MSIPLSQCRHGGLYKLSSRNLGLGVFREATKDFVGIREKFGNEYLAGEYHWDCGAPFGTAHPMEYIEQCPIDDLRTGWTNESNTMYVDNKVLSDWLQEKRKVVDKD